MTLLRAVIIRLWFWLGYVASSSVNSYETGYKSVSNGTNTCAIGSPVQIVKARSNIECSRFCAQLHNQQSDQPCLAFNFWKDRRLCELFGDLNSIILVSEDQPCRFYKVSFTTD